MNGYEKFLELPNEKQLRIINAGFEYFGKYGYKGANTEDIANKAGISKGALFYYFKNKESFYLYLHEFCQNQTRKYKGMKSPVFTITICFQTTITLSESLVHNSHKVFNQLSIFSIQGQRKKIFRLILTSLNQLPIFVEQGLRANPILHTFPKRSSSQDIIRMLTVKLCWLVNINEIAKC